MFNYVLRRLLLIIPTVFIVITVVFVLMRVIPGDVAQLILSGGGVGASAGGSGSVELKAVREELGLDKPIPMQFLIYVRKALQGDFGRSFYDKQPVINKIKEALPVTLQLALMTSLVSLSIAIPVGVLSAIRQDSWPDYVVRVLTIMGLSVPVFWTATLLIVFPAIWWHYLPPLVYMPPWEDLPENLQMYAFPVLALGVALSGSVARMTRATMLEVLRQDYIRTAWAKGLRERLVVARHAIKNAMIPVVTFAGLQFASLLGGTVIVESIFALPGLGRLTVFSVFERDFPQLQANILLFSTTILVVNLFVDLTYGWLDPRIRYR